MSVDLHPPITVRIPDEKLEHFVRRIVREELLQLLDRQPSIAENWLHEGESDEAGDELLLKDGLAVLAEYVDRSETWMSWADFEAELERAEAAGELPD